jgi:hypothetical protein
LTTSLTDAAFQAAMISGGQSDLNIWSTVVISSPRPASTSNYCFPLFKQKHYKVLNPILKGFWATLQDLLCYISYTISCFISYKLF